MSDKFSFEDMPAHDVKRISSHTIANTTTVVILIGTVIAALISMGEISLTMSNLRDITLLCCVIFVVSSMVYSARYEASMQVAKNDDAYKTVITEYERCKAEIHSRGLITKLPYLCMRYCAEELKIYRSEILSDACIPYEVYEAKYRDLSKAELESLKLSKSAVKCILKANNAKGIRLTTAELMSGKKNSVFRIATVYFAPETRQFIDTSLNVASRIATTLLSGAVVISVMFEPSLKAVAQWAVRMLPVVSAAISGTIAGQKNVINTAIPYYLRLTEILKTCIKWESESDCLPAELPAEASAE